jgi:Protein of unknown function (DUF3540)
MSSTPVIPLSPRGRAPGGDESGPFVRPARLVRDAAGGLFAEVDVAGSARRVPAESALAGPLPGDGTRVLVTGESAERCYVIGVLGAEAEGGPVSERRVRAATGESAAIEGAAGAERIVVRDARGQALFERCSASGRTVVSAPSGDLVLAAPNGDVEIVSGGEVRCRGASVDLRASGASGAALHVGASGARLSGRALEIVAETGRMLIADLAYRGLRVDATLERVRSVAGQVESVTGRLVQRAKSLFREVEEVEHVTAGRMRTVVEGSYVVRGGSASVTAEEDVKIDGKRVYLG